MHELTGVQKISACAGAGLFFGITLGSIEAVWSIPKLGTNLPKFSSQLKHIGGRCILFGAAATLYATIEYAAESIRHKKDFMNAGIAGALAGGSVVGIRSGNARTASGAALITAAASGACSYWETLSDDPFERYAAARKAREGRVE
ncbi:hypothetical protein ABG067_005093 [Albugo candida]|uniref:Mitochondrial import inner membrane translocase subunit TIM22 n=1 Tax=Albugo candida TaxID=65357 RepID=A0A024G6D5_9STRA|nr:unnamed protein product [Albugo candida]|eukprot:CCI42317.1 unnamed protein product [Albugo candida]